MKPSTILASALFGALAVAAPLKQRALRTTTITILETVTQYHTVFPGESTSAPSTSSSSSSSSSSVAPAATTAAYLFEDHATSTASSTTPAAPSSTPVQPSSAYTPPPPPPTSTQAPAYTPPPPPPPPSSAPPKPAYTPPPPPPPPAPASSPAPAPQAAPAAQSNSVSGSGQVYDSFMTVYDIPSGAAGSCSTVLSDDMPTVALAKEMMGPPVYDSNGKGINPNCGKKIIIDYNGKKTTATIMDTCPGCAPEGIDLTRSLWATVVGPNDPGSKLPVKWQYA